MTDIPPSPLSHSPPFDPPHPNQDPKSPFYIHSNENLSLVLVSPVLEGYPPLKVKSVLDPCEDDNEGIQDDMSTGDDSVQNNEYYDTDSEVDHSQGDQYIVAPIEKQQAQEDNGEIDEGNDGNYHASETAKQGAQAVKLQPIEVPEIQANELKEVTDNFGQDSLIGEGSYGRVYYGVLKNGPAAAIKKLDASRQPGEEFLAQVSMVSRLKHANFVQLLGFCVDGNSCILAYEFASNGSLHDILHGRKGVNGAQPGPVLTWA